MSALEELELEERERVGSNEERFRGIQAHGKDTDTEAIPDYIGEASIIDKSVEEWSSLVRPAMAEFIGCVFFMFITLGAVLSDDTIFTLPGPQQIAISLTFGFTVFVCAFAIGHISGGHLNPAVTLSLWVTGKVSLRKLVMYFIGQFVGSIVGASLLRFLTPSLWRGKSCIGANLIDPAVTPGMALGIEFVLTFFLLFVVHAATDTAKSNQVMVPLAIGMAVCVCHFVAIHIDGTSINPTRSFASAVASMGIEGCYDVVWNNQWVFWVGPLVGGVCGGLTYDSLFAIKDGLQNSLDVMYQAKHVQQPIKGVRQADSATGSTEKKKEWYKKVQNPWYKIVPK